MSQLRIFSYLPNPRIWKATIAARLCDVEIEVRGAPPTELAILALGLRRASALARRRAEPAGEQIGRTGFKGVKLRKTRAFLEAHPFGTVPAAFSPDGKVGIFESNSIMRAVARLGEGRFPLYGSGPYEASRVDSFLDASLVFARDAQPYLLSLLDGSVSAEIQSRPRDALATYLAGISRALLPERRSLVGDGRDARRHLLRRRVRALLERTGTEATRSSEEASRRFSTGSGVTPHTRRPSRISIVYARHPAFAPDVEPYLEKIDRAA